MSDEVRLDISGAGKSSISGDNPNINRDDVQCLHHEPADSVLRSRKIVAAKTNLIATTSQSQSQQQVEKETKSSTTDHKVSATASPSETPDVTLRERLLPSPASEANDEDDNGHSPKPKKPEKSRRINIGLGCCFLVMVIFIIHVTTHKLVEYKIDNIEIWKLFCLDFPFFLGVILLEWPMNIILEKISLLGKINDKTKVPSKFFYSLLNSYLVVIWLSVTSWIWWFLIGPPERQSIDSTTTLRFLLKAFSCAVQVAVAWTLRSIAIAYLYASFYNKKFSKRIQENRFRQYVLETLSGKPVGELSEVHSFRSVDCRGSNVIDVQTLLGFMRWVIEATLQTRFYTLPNTLDESKDLMNPDEKYNRIITTEREAKAVSDHIFKNVAKPEHKYIEEEDLLRFMNKEDVDMVLPSIGRNEESGRIDEKHFLKWVVSMYLKSKYLEHSLNDINKAIETLLKFVDVLLVVLLIILWVILMDITTTEVLLFISSQFLLAVFTFGNFLKSTFEAMMFVILKHPFDVGDRCVIDGVQVVVEKVSISTSVFLKYDNEKIYYPNSILSTKSISNLNRSPEMRDTVEFDLDASTSVENISALKEKIKTYIENKPHFWRPKHSVRVKGVTNVNNNIKMIKMSLYVTHTLKFPDYEEKCDRRSNLVLELRNIFRVLKIEGYQILPSTSCD